MKAILYFNIAFTINKNHEIDEYVFKIIIIQKIDVASIW